MRQQVRVARATSAPGPGQIARAQDFESSRARRARYVARALLGQAVMVNATPLPLLSVSARKQVLRFAASFLWADLHLDDTERVFLAELARELDVGGTPDEIEALLAAPPPPEDVDPSSVAPGTADLIRHMALRAIAADGRVGSEEMTMFELLDELLPRSVAATSVPSQKLARKIARPRRGEDRAIPRLSHLSAHPPSTQDVR